MRKSKFSKEQIALVLRQAESGTPPDEIYRRLGISWAKFDMWRGKYAGMGVGEVLRLRQLD